MHTCCPILKKSFLFSKDDSAPYSPPGMFILYPHPRACLKKAFCKMCVTICGRFCPDEGAVAGYGNRIRAKYTAKWGVQIAGMIFQTGSNVLMLTHAAYFTDQALEDMVHNSLIVTSQYFKTMKEQP